MISLNTYLRQRFGCKVYKLSLETGCTCPNRDGSISTGGCTFCSTGGSGEFACSSIEKAKEKVESKLKHIPESQRKYIAYFQSYSNTYETAEMPFEKLKSIFLEAAAHKEIVAISIGTRPDCISDRMINFLSSLNKTKPIWIELGLQTSNEITAEKINRGYKNKTFEETFKKLTENGLEIILHILLGLPGETEEDMLNTIRYVSKFKPQGVKLQNLQILEGTKIAADYKKSPFSIFSLAEYAELVVKCLNELPKETVVHRLTGDGPKSILIEPKWSADKKKVLNYLNKKTEGLLL
ncbi:MAG: TIGR01212 family radical SAM protein [Treponema sp.]|nr:TIGR01212 family radical SAM protein [Treponema sp.]